jgi:hypothetical protein
MSALNAAGLLEAVGQVAARGVRRAPIVDGHGHLEGPVSMDDVVPLLAREFAKISALSGASRPARCAGPSSGPSN